MRCTNVLFARGPTFSPMLAMVDLSKIPPAGKNHNYRASAHSFQESSTNRVVLQEEPALVRQMIAYFYSLDYQVDDWQPESDHGPPGEAPILEASASANTFVEHSSQHSDGGIDQDIPGRSDETVQDSVTSFDSVWFHILMYSLADRMVIEGLKAISKDKVERELAQRLDANTFPHAIVEIYNSTPASDRGLRDLAVRMTMDCLTELRTVEDASQMPFPDSLVNTVPQFSSDLLVAMMNRTVPDWNQYGICGKNWTQERGGFGTSFGGSRLFG